MKFGLSPSQYHYILETVVVPLELAGATVWCYGSRARGNHTPFSDLDLMIETEKNLSQEISSLKETLQNSNFPFKIDLVRFADFAESYRAGYQQDKKLFRVMY